MSWSVLVPLVSVTQVATLQAGSTEPIVVTQPRPSIDPAVTLLEEVVVVGRRGSTQLTPEIELGEAEIDGLGAYDIGEVIYRISRNLGFAEPPVIIVNGRRALNPGDFTRFPPDALVRVEALPPEAGAIYGDDPSRRVLNIVLQPEFKSRDGLLRGARPTAGGRSSQALDLRQSEIHENTTRQFGMVVSRDTTLRAEERDAYSRDHPGSEGLTLRPPSDSLSANFSATGAIGDWSTSLNTTAEAQRSRFVFVSGGQAIETREETHNLAATGGLGGEAMGWSVRLGLDGNLSDARQSGIADFQSRNLSATVNIGADRALMELPAGSLRASLTSRLSYAESVADIDEIRTRQSTQDLDVGGTLSVPLLRRRQPAEDGRGLKWGDISATLGGRLRGLVGTSTRGEGVNLGLNWSPVQKLRFSTQWSMSTDGPADQQRLAPISYGPPVVVFDFLTGESVEILPILGGNPDLQPQTLHNFSASASAGPYTSWQMSGSVSFTRARSTEGISSLPVVTPEVEAAFPDRFTRDADGRLISIDQRPINLDSDVSESLSSNLNFSIPFSKTPSADAPYLQLGISHTLQLTNQLTIHQGLPDMNRLAGGGVPRHQVSLYADGRYRKWGLNAGGSWRSASRIRRDSGKDGPDDLRLGDFARVDLKLSYVFDPPNSSNPAGERARRYQGLRIELAVDNLFDTRPEATLGDGRPAPGYGRDDQDPLGRVVRLTVSRRF
ncbi:MAG: TonB-dependent receptor [Brevundimonas sp.]